MNTLILLYLVLFVAPISNLIHELGHLIGAKLAKADEVKVYIGRGTSVCKFVYRTTEIDIGSVFFTSGFTVSRREELYKPIEIVYITFFGPFLNAAVALILYLLFLHMQNDYILVLILYNCWLFVMNCIPFKIKDQQSDGYIIMKELIGKGNK
jgi:Peptidase family M50